MFHEICCLISNEYWVKQSKKLPESNYMTKMNHGRKLLKLQYVLLLVFWLLTNLIFLSFWGYFADPKPPKVMRQSVWHHKFAHVCLVATWFTSCTLCFISTIKYRFLIYQFDAILSRKIVSNDLCIPRIFHCAQHA